MSELPEAGEVTRGVRGFALTAMVLVTSFMITWLAQLDVVGLRDRLSGYLALWPQEWSFFVDLEDDVLVGYQVEPGSPRLSPRTERQYWTTWSWGLNRIGYAESAELRAVARRVPDQYWYACDEPDLADCGNLRDDARTHRMNRPRGSALCGQVAIAVERTSAFPDRRLPEKPRQLYRIAFVDLECTT